MAHIFHSLDELQTLDRLQIAPPRGFKPTWRLHVVEVREFLGDRVYGFFGVPEVSVCAFAFYPEDLTRTFGETRGRSNGAWPYFQKPSQPLPWRTLNTPIGEYAQLFATGALPDLPRGRSTVNLWYLRFDEDGRTYRCFAWCRNRGHAHPHWLTLQLLCHETAAQLLHFPVAYLACPDPPRLPPSGPTPTHPRPRAPR